MHKWEAELLGLRRACGLAAAQCSAWSCARQAPWVWAWALSACLPSWGWLTRGAAFRERTASKHCCSMLCIVSHLSRGMLMVKYRHHLEQGSCLEKRPAGAAR